MPANEFLDRYLSQPIKRPTKEEAIKRLKILGVLDDNEKLKDEWADIIIETIKDDSRQEHGL